MDLRPYDAERDSEASFRIWREAGWMDGSPEGREAAGIFMSGSRGLVAELEGEPECLVLTMPATVRYLDEDLPMCGVASVATSHVGRKQRLASRTTALSVARDASEGALVAALGMFEQGYYDQLGFGTGTYEHWVGFDPAQLAVPGEHRPPRRLTPTDWEAAHATRLQRVRGHGAVNLLPPEFTRGEMTHSKSTVGLGYFDGPAGELSHCLWARAENMAHGPYRIHWLAYRTREQFLELMAVLKSLGDQVSLVTMAEPPGIQLQDLMRKPFKQRRISEKSSYAAGIHAAAWWQIRVCDLPGCLARTHLPAGSVRFSLRLSDPIERFLGPEAPWRGVAGDYVVSLGPSSSAEPGNDPALPTLSATVNAFTRMWMGVRPATGLAITDQLEASPELLAELDDVLCLPRPQPDWAF
jgi:hypothetical protein